MDAEVFLRKTDPNRNFDGQPDFIRGDSIRLNDPAWSGAAARLLSGAALILIAAFTANFYGQIAGWLGMTGIILLLHFGLFDLLAFGWRQAGLNVKPVMNSPLRSGSLAEFWGKRWNTAFNTLAYSLVFRPLAKRAGVIRATMAVFLVSGLVHESVISLPAKGGYGLPTAYFILQGLGVLFEKSSLGRRLGLAHGFRGWLFMAVFTAVPAYWLFHPPFINNVILPMLKIIGTNWKGIAMTTSTMITLLQIAGAFHLVLLGAGLLMPGAVRLKEHLLALPLFIRRLFWVYYAFIALCVVGFGLITFGLAEPLAGGGMLARSVCIFFAAFWILRLLAAAFIFDVRPYLTNTLLRAGYYTINFVFVYLPCVYLLAAWKGGKP
jgi:hypothetical protein